MRKGVSVVVPLNNINYITNVLDNIARQTYYPQEVIIVINGINLVSQKLEFEQNRNTIFKVFLLDKSSASAARNLGMQKATFKYIALMDCDDYWFPNKIRDQIELIERLDDEVILISRAYQFSKIGLELRPKFKFTGPLLISKLYKWRFNRSEIFLPTPSWFFSRQIAEKVSFDENLSNREDIKFLIDAEQVGIKILQMDSALVWVNHDLNRALSRETLHSYFTWVKHLNSYSNRQMINFALGIGLRNLIISYVFKVYRSVKVHLK